MMMAWGQPSPRDEPLRARPLRRLALPALAESSNLPSVTPNDRSAVAGQRVPAPHASVPESLDAVNRRT